MSLLYYEFNDCIVYTFNDIAPDSHGVDCVVKPPAEYNPP